MSETAEIKIFYSCNGNLLLARKSHPNMPPSGGILGDWDGFAHFNASSCKLYAAGPYGFRPIGDMKKYDKIRHDLQYIYRDICIEVRNRQDDVVLKFILEHNEDVAASIGSSNADRAEHQDFDADSVKEWLDIAISESLAFAKSARINNYADPALPLLGRNIVYCLSLKDAHNLNHLCKRRQLGIHFENGSCLAGIIVYSNLLRDGNSGTFIGSACAQIFHYFLPEPYFVSFDTLYSEAVQHGGTGYLVSHINQFLGMAHDQINHRA